MEVGEIQATASQPNWVTHGVSALRCVWLRLLVEVAFFNELNAW